jgi:hypothetical protein
MKLKSLAALAAVSALASCATTPGSPMETYLNRYAGAETIATNCPAYGGYSSVAQMRADAEKNLAQAKALGATEADVKKARDRVNGNFVGASILVGDMQTCSAFMNKLAWVGSTPVEPTVVKPKKVN